MGVEVSAVNPGVYRDIFRVKIAIPFDLGCFLIRFFFYMTNIGTVTMLTLSGYSFVMAGLISSVIALSIFLIAPRISKLIDERGQSRVIPFAALLACSGLVVILANVSFGGPEWVCLIGAVLLGFLPNAQALARSRWIFLLRTKRLGGSAPDVKTIFSYEGVLDDVAFMLSPPTSIALATAIMPVAGLLIGGIGFVVGCAIVTLSKSTEPTPGWTAEGAEDAECAESAEGNASARSMQTSASGRKSVFRLSPVVRILFILLLLTGMFFGIFDTTAVAFAEGLGNPNIASIGLMVSGFISMVIGFLFGMLRINLPLYKQLILFSGLVGLAYGSMMLIESVPVFFAVSFTAAVFYAPFLIVANSACERAVPTTRLTEAITWINAGMTCGMAFGPLLGGVMIDTLGSAAAFDLGGIVALAIPATSLLCMRIIRRNVKSDSYQIKAMGR